MLLPSTIFCLILATHAQRYAERNALPAAEVPPLTSNSENDDNYYEEEYGFDDETNVYKWNVEEYPHPRLNSKFCHRIKPSNVCDPDLVLTTEQADDLDSFIHTVFTETPCICEICSPKEGGIVVGIALLKHMFQPYIKHPVKIIKAFAEELRKKWTLGKCDNDIVIVIATADRLFYTDVGPLAAKYIPLHEAHRIFLENKWLFSQGQFYEGLRNILSQYHNVTRGMQTSALSKAGPNMSVIAGIIIGTIVLIGVVLFIAFMLYKKYKNGKDKESYSKSNRSRNIFKNISVFTMDKSGKYRECGTEEVDKSKPEEKVTEQHQKCAIGENIEPIPEEDEMIDFTLATAETTSSPNDTQLTSVRSDSETLEKDLEKATEGIIKTFPSSKNTVIITDM